jgi:hypothetical protein
MRSAVTPLEDTKILLIHIVIAVEITLTASVAKGVSRTAHTRSALS